MRTRNTCLLRLVIASLFLLSALDLSFRLSQNVQPDPEVPEPTLRITENGSVDTNASSSWLDNERMFCPPTRKKERVRSGQRGEEASDLGALIVPYLARVKKVLPIYENKKNIPAIVIPYRDRRSHLGPGAAVGRICARLAAPSNCGRSVNDSRISHISGAALETLLQNLVPAESRGNQPHAVYVVEQLGKAVFNRGMLFNIGFMVALAHGNHSCFVFHDVDMVPAKTNPPYHCSAHPRHLAYAVDSFWGRMPYDDYAGGVIAMTSQQYFAINGHSNRYWGWGKLGIHKNVDVFDPVTLGVLAGGEDDDLSLRIARAQMWLDRGNMTEAKYHMLPHKKDKSNPRNRFRRILVKLGSRAGGDGLTSLCFEIVSVRQNSSLNYVHVGVTLDIAENRTAMEIARLMKRVE